MKKTTTLSLVLLLFAISSSFSQGLKYYVPEGKYIGAAVSNNYLQNNGSNLPIEYEETFVKDFNCVVAENAFKMSYIIPNRPSNPFNLSISDLSTSGLASVDTMLNIAERHGMRTRGHAFMWYSQSPDWLQSDARGWTKDQIYDFAESYITVFGTYCKGRVDEWDVFNEALDDGNAVMRTGTWYDNVGDVQAFIEHCITVANTVDPEADLFYNDYNIEFNGNDKTTKMLNMANSMVENGVPIDGIGLQSHFISGMDEGAYNAIATTIDAVGNLGLKCNITELDLRICGGTTTTSLERQKDDYENITKMIMERDHCNSLVIWGITDAASWIPQFFEGCDDALIYDREMKKKPAYYGVLKALKITSGILEGPYEYEAQTIPGKVQFERYDYATYKDNDTTNQGGVFRNDPVDIAEGNNGYVVGWTDSGEYLNYTVEVAQTDTFQVSLMYAYENSVNDTTIIDLYVDEEKVAESFKLISTGSWETFESLAQEGVILTEGEHLIRVEIIKGGAIIDYMEFLSTDCAGVLGGTAYIDDCNECVGGTTGITECINRSPFTEMNIPGIVEAEYYDLGKNGVSYNDISEGDSGNNDYRDDDVDMGTTNDGKEGDDYVIAWTDAGEWLEYTVNINNTATYNVTFRYASAIGGGEVRMLVDNKIVIRSLNLGNTGDWNVFGDAIANNISLETGEAVIRLEIINGGFNLNHFAFDMTSNAKNSELQNIRVYPNPFSSKVNIVGLQENTNWNLYSTDGRLVKYGKEKTIETGDLHIGLYLLKVNNEIIKITKR